MRHGNIMLPTLHSQVCAVLNVAPLLAAEIVAFAERRHLPLEPYRWNGDIGDLKDDDGRFARAYQAFCDARVPLHLHAA